MDFKAQLAARVAPIEAAIDRLLPPADSRPARLHGAMRYSFESGGKRLRPVLVVAAAELFAERSAIDPLPAAVAVECVHTYSLIHDDLPCMDDDDLRRGRPTVHKAFDEATAVLAGDALLTHAFALLATGYAGHPALAAALVADMAEAAGSARLVGGQMEDLMSERKPAPTAEDLDFIHLNKTAAMIGVALVLGGRIGGTDAAGVATLRELGRHLGLAFQIVDDILDATADTAALGKTAGKDAKAGKATFVRLHGLESSRRLALGHTDAALAALEKLPGNRAFLRALIEAMLRRGA